MMNPLQNTLEAQVNMVRMPQNSTLTFKVDKNTAWVADILKELNEKATDKSPEEWLQETDLTVDITLKKCFKGELGEYLLAKGNISATYATECIRTLQPMKESFSAEFNTCFAAENVLESEEYAETGEIWVDGETRELYAHKRNLANIAEMIHEQAFLNYNHYPRLDADGPLNLDIPSDKPRQ